MYPEWLLGMFGNNPCTACRAALTLDDIETVGVRRPDRPDWPYPSAVVVCACRRCGNRMQCTIDQPLEAVLAAVAALYREVADAAPPKTGAFEVPPQQAKADPRRLRPSRRRDQPAAPPTDAEVRAFLAVLNEMSFRTGGKGLDKLIGERAIPEETEENRDYRDSKEGIDGDGAK